MFPVSKNSVPPISLERRTSYSEKDVIETLSKDFHNKCYICEVKDPLGKVRISRSFLPKLTR